MFHFIPLAYLGTVPAWTFLHTIGLPSVLFLIIPPFCSFISCLKPSLRNEKKEELPFLKSLSPLLEIEKSSIVNVFICLIPLLGKPPFFLAVLRKLKTDAERNEDRNGFHSPTYNTASLFVPAFPKMLCALWYRSDARIVLPAVSAPHTRHEDVATPSSLCLWHFAKTVLCLNHCLWCGTPG